MRLLKRLTSRYGVLREVWRESADTLVLSGKARYMRWGGTPQQTTMVDWDGGPCVCVGDPANEVLGVRTKRPIDAIEPIKETEIDSEGVVRIRLHLRRGKP